MKLWRRNDVKFIGRGFLMFAFLLAFCCILPGQAFAKERYTVKTTKEGIYYSTDTERILRAMKPKTDDAYGMTLQEYNKFAKKYKGKKMCVVLGYAGKKVKNLRLPEKIEGSSHYILCVDSFDGYYMKKVTIPAKVNIEKVLLSEPGEQDEPYHSCRVDYVVEKGNRSLKSKNGVLYSRDGKTIYAIPAFYKSKKFIVPDNVETVYFSSCVYELVLGKNVSKFVYCHPNEFDLKKIRVKKGNANFTVKNNILYSKDKSILYFSLSKDMESFVMPDSVTELKSYAFYYHDKLKKIVFSNRLKVIPKEAFCFCEKLSDIDYGSGVRVIEDENLLQDNPLILPKNIEKLGYVRQGVHIITYNKDLMIYDDDEDEWDNPIGYVSIQSQVGKDFLFYNQNTLEIR